ncbi:MAG TPA: tagaturonate reductase [Clostridiales bacterium]|nr:tagaturonate reductase [Clostridiales bacterium]
MKKVLQYGEGNFLRSFVDLYFETLNREGGEWAVEIVKPIPFGSLDAFARQGNRYHVVLRGVKDGNAAETVYPVSVVEQAISPFEDFSAYAALAVDPELAVIVSNTTEAGICYHEGDSFDGFAEITYPAKLTKFLYARFKAGLSGLYLLPVELIENNADELFRCVEKYIDLWQLPVAFREWNRTENFYCNTLVDRIVSGFPRDEALRERLWKLVGERDDLLSVAEPFGLWVIENKGKIADLLPAGHHNIDVILTDDIAYYKKRKVRVLNGSHTNLVAAGLLSGAETVYDCMTNETLYRFFRASLEEIVPFVSSDRSMTERFAADVEERFRNPYLNHQLTSIALNSISKWRARVLPTFRDFFAANGRIPEHLTVGFSCLMHLYRTKYAELKDDEEVLSFFASGKPLKDLLSDRKLWGEDLTAYPQLLETVTAQTERLARGESLL